jgi:hypothetical protein
VLLERLPSRRFDKREFVERSGGGRHGGRLLAG